MASELHPKYKLMLEDDFDLSAQKLFDEFWIWQECMVLNEMSDFKNSDETDTGKKSNFVVKMSAPIGPKHADVQMIHTYQKVKLPAGIMLVNEIEHKTSNFPYADYFDIIHR